MTIQIYDLAVEGDRRMSPFCWRIKLALAHKGLDFETVPVGFMDIPRLHDGEFKTVPIMETGEMVMNESWAIADYLDKIYTDHNPIFSSAAERATIRFFDSWYGLEIMNRLFMIYVYDIHQAAYEADRPYFRASREKRLGGRSLEEVVADREAKLPDVRHALRPLRATLAGQPFIGGDRPNYADFIALSGFFWVRAVATLPLFEKDDPVYAYVERGLDLFDGLARRNPGSALAA